VPCIANVDLEGRVFRKELPSQPLECSRFAGEGGERKIVHSFGTGTWACAQNGKWIRTDSECKRRSPLLVFKQSMCFYCLRSLNGPFITSMQPITIHSDGSRFRFGEAYCFRQPEGSLIYR